MKIFVKTLKGTSFEIDVKLEDKVSDVKKSIESTQGQTYPAEQQMLIYQGKVLKDDTTLEENKVAENTFIVVMLSKAKGSASGASTATKTPAPAAPPTNTVQSAPTVPAPVPSQAPPSTLPPAPANAPAPTATAAPAPAVSVSADGSDVYGEAASHLVSGSGLEQTVQQILDMGGGTWDRPTVLRALRAAFNNPDRAIDYLYSGIPEVEAPPVARVPPAGAGQVAAAGNPAPGQPAPQQPAVPSSGPNADPLDLFPQGLPAGIAGAAGAGAGGLEMLRNNPQFRALLALVQSNPQILQPMLQELGKQNPQILRIIQDNQAEFLRMVNESNTEGAGVDPNLLGQLAGLAGAMPRAIQVTPEEQEAIERLEAMGFNRELVLQVFFACNKNEELAANYLLDHVHEFEDQ